MANQPGVEMQTLTFPLRPDGTMIALTVPRPMSKADIAALRGWMVWLETFVLDQPTVEGETS